LITLTVGMLLATIMQFCFRQLRTRMAAKISFQADQELAERVLHCLSTSRALQLLDFGRPKLQESVSSLQQIRNAYSGANISSFLDGPFAALYLGAAFLISPILAGIGMIAMVFGAFLGISNIFVSKRNSASTRKKNLEQRSLVISAVNNLETVRTFFGADFLSGPFKKATDNLFDSQQKEILNRELNKNLNMTMTILLSVALYVVGAILVVEESITVGALIGINILVTRAFSTLNQLIQSINLIILAQKEQNSLNTLFALDVEQEEGTTLQAYTGIVEFKNLGFT